MRHAALAFGLVTVAGASVLWAAPVAETEAMAVLADRSATPSRREAAAVRLLSAGTTEPVLRALIDAADAPGQLAAARAVLATGASDAGFVAPLLGLLSDDPVATGVAAAALARQADAPQVTALLLAFGTDPARPEAARAAAIAALAVLPERRVVETLVRLATDLDQSRAIRSAASDALMEMTGLSRLGRSREAWLAWWRGVAEEPEAVLRDRLLSRRALRAVPVQAPGQRPLLDTLSRLLIAAYRGSEGETRSAMMIQHLRDGAAEVRLAALRALRAEILENRGIGPPVRAELRSLLTDELPAVRMEATDTLRLLNDPASLPALLERLPTEPEPGVRAAIARALGPLQDRRAVGALLPLLADGDPRVVVAAAAALGQKGPAIQGEHELGELAGNQLRAALEHSRDDRAADDVREAILESAAALRRRELVPDALALLESATPAIRQAALKLLGRVREPGAAPAITALLSVEPVASVRAEALAALGAIPTFEHAETIGRFVFPEHEPDPAVRVRAWEALEQLLPQANREQLRAWEQRLAGDPARRLVLVQALVRQYSGLEDGLRRMQAHRLAATLQLALLRPVEASESLREAIELARAGGLKDETEVLRAELVDALLLGRLFEQAAQEAAGDSALAGKLVAHARTLEADRGLARELLLAMHRAGIAAASEIAAQMQIPLEAPATLPDTAPGG